MQRIRNYSLALVLIVLGASTHTVLGQEGGHSLSPEDFMIPEKVLSALESEAALRTSGGYFTMTNQSFSDWLKKTGPFGEMVALHDQRRWTEARKIPISPIDVSDTDLRVCDVAYQMIESRKEGRSLLMKTRSTQRERDILIAQMLKSYPAQFLSFSKSQGTKE